MAGKTKAINIVDEFLSLSWILLLSVVVVKDNTAWGIMASAAIFAVCYLIFLSARFIFMRK